MGFYDDIQAVATEVLAEFAQGVCTLTRTTIGEPADPDEPFEPGASSTTVYTLDATVRRVEQRYVDGSLIVATDDQVTFAVPEITPRMSDKITIDGVVRTLKMLKPKPASGTPVAYIAIVGT